MTRKNDYPVNPRSVPQLCATKEKLVRTYWYLFWHASIRYEIKGALVCVQRVIWLLGPQCTMQATDK